MNDRIVHDCAAHSLKENGVPSICKRIYACTHRHANTFPSRQDTYIYIYIDAALEPTITATTALVPAVTEDVFEVRSAGGGVGQFLKVSKSTVKRWTRMAAEFDQQEQRLEEDARSPGCKGLLGRQEGQ